MEDFGGFIVLAACAILVVWYFLAKEFYAIAQEKGYDDRKYFWWSFLFGIAGCLLVVALPDRSNAQKEINASIKDSRFTTQTTGNLAKANNDSKPQAKSNSKSISNGAYKNNKSITNVTIPDDVTKIGQEAFYNCHKLESVLIPVSVTEISSGAFHGCKSLANICYTGSREEWNKIYISFDNDYLTKAKIIFNYTE